MKPELVLLDLAVGHFARLELIIGFKVHFARELSQFASCVEANRTSSQPSGGGQIISPSASAFSNGPVISGNEDNYAGNSGQQIDNVGTIAIIFCVSVSNPDGRCSDSKEK